MLTSMPISLSLFPMISRKFNESLQSGLVVYKKCIIYAAIFASSVSILTYFAAPLIVKLFLGEEFIQAIPLLRIFSPLPFLIIMASMFTVQGLYGLQLQRYAPIVSGIAGVVCVGINFTLIPEYGMYSAAAGYMFAEFIEIIISVSIIFIYLTKKRRNA